MNNVEYYQCKVVPISIENIDTAERACQKTMGTKCINYRCEDCLFFTESLFQQYKKENKC